MKKILNTAVLTLVSVFSTGVLNASDPDSMSYQFEDTVIQKLTPEDIKIMNPSKNKDLLVQWSSPLAKGRTHFMIVPAGKTLAFGPGLRSRVSLAGESSAVVAGRRLYFRFIDPSPFFRINELKSGENELLIEPHKLGNGVTVKINGLEEKGRLVKLNN